MRILITLCTVILMSVFTGVLRAEPPRAATSGATATAPTPTPTALARLPLQVDGPVKVSPWRSVETTSTPAKDHYMYSAPVPYYCGYYGFYGWPSFPCGGGFTLGYYVTPAVLP